MQCSLKKISGYALGAVFSRDKIQVQPSVRCSLKKIFWLRPRRGDLQRQNSGSTLGAVFPTENIWLRPRCGVLYRQNSGSTLVQCSLKKISGYALGAVFSRDKIQVQPSVRCSLKKIFWLRPRRGDLQRQNSGSTLGAVFPTENIWLRPLRSVL